MYFLWYFIRQNKTVVYESVENKRLWVFSSDGCRSFAGIADTDSCPELNNRETYFLFDAKAGDNCHEPVKCPAFLVLFSSPNVTSYKQFSRGNVPKVGYTSPSYEELLLLGKALKMEEEDIHRKFIKYGPDIRFVIAVSEKIADRSINNAITKFNARYIYSYIDGTSSNAHRSDNPSVLFKTTVWEDEFDTLDDAYSCENIQWEFASKNICEKVFEKFKKCKTEFVEEFLLSSEGIPEMATLRGYFLELLAPTQIAAGGNIVIRSLTENNNKTLEPILFHQFPKVDVEKVSYSSGQIQDMLNECTNSKKLYNIGGNFPAIDLYNPPSTFFQLTVRKSGHPIDLNSICTICKFVRDRYGNETDVNLYFVVPDDIFDNWRNMQSFKYTPETASKVIQCVFDKLEPKHLEILSNLKQFVYSFDSNSKSNKLKETKKNVILSNDDDEIKTKKN